MRDIERPYLHGVAVPASWAGVLLVALSQQRDRIGRVPMQTSTEIPIDDRTFSRLAYAHQVADEDEHIPISPYEAHHIVEGLRGIEGQFRLTMDRETHTDREGTNHISIIGLIARQKYHTVQTIADQITAGCLESEQQRVELPYDKELSEHLISPSI
jgi:hypothetical protein